MASHPEHRQGRAGKFGWRAWSRDWVRFDWACALHRQSSSSSSVVPPVGEEDFWRELKEETELF